MDFFGAAHGSRSKKAPSLKSVTDIKMMKLGTAITFLKKIQKIHKRDTSQQNFFIWVKLCCGFGHVTKVC